MRPIRIQLSWSTLGVAVVAASVISLQSIAQQPGTTTRGAKRRAAATGQGMSPIASAHATFERAARIMESALPIYDGHRHRAIQLAKLAAKEIKEAATGTPTTTGTTGASGSVKPMHKTAAQRAAAIQKGANIGLSKYTPQQISASNTKMQEGLQLLQQGLQRVQAIGNDPGNHMNDAAEFGNYAIEAANKGLAFVAGKQ